MAKHDFNGDGRSDIFWQGWDGPVSSWLATPTGDFILNPRYAYAPHDAAVGDLGDYNGDGFADVLMYAGADGVYVLAGRADGGFVISTPPPRPTSGWYPDYSGNFNGDAHADIVWVGDTASRLSVWFGDSALNFTTGPVVEFAGLLTPGSSWVMGVGDSDNDGRDNILMMNNTNRSVISWAPTATGEFLVQNQSVIGVAAADWSFMGNGDFNGDGFEDLSWSHNLSGATSIWSGSATGYVVKKGGDAAPGWYFSGGIGDYNGDGRDELIWMEKGRLSRWVSDAAGEWTSVTVTASVTGGDAWFIMPW